jgi:GTP pyrophosphokinase
VLAQQRQQARDNGRSALIKAFRQDGVDGSEKILDAAAKVLKQASLDDLYVAVGNSNIGPKDVVHAAYPELRPTSRVMPMLPGRGSGKPSGKSISALPITGVVAGMAIQFAGCCHPLPGDRITGIVTTGKGVTVHTRECPTLESFAATPERFIDIDWEESAFTPAKGELNGHTGRVLITADNDPGAIASITTAISRQNTDVVSLKIISRQQDFFEMLVDVEVRDLNQFVQVIASLRAAKYVHQVERARG